MNVTRVGIVGRKAKRIAHNLICDFIFYSQLYRAVRFLRDSFPNRRSLIILAYHKINDDYEKGRNIRPHVRGVPVDDFRRQMAYLRSRHNVVPLQTAVWLMKNGAKLPRNAVALTFDDGYRDNYTYAYPILRAYRLPATFFLTTGFIGCKRPSWQVALSAYLRLTPHDVLVIDFFDKCLDRLAEAGKKYLSSSEPYLAGASPSLVLRVMLKLLGPDVIERLVDEFLPEPLKADFRLPLITPKDRAQARQFLTGNLRSRPLYERELMLDILRVRLGLKGAIYVPFGQMMTWEMVNDMSQNGMSFGAHTCTHPILTRVSCSCAEKEVIRSRRRLEAMLKKPVKLFCYPSGLTCDFSDELAAEVKKAGFEAAFTMIPSENNHPVQLFALGRITPEKRLGVFATKVSRILR